MRWLKVVQQSLTKTTIQFIASPYVVDGVQDTSLYIYQNTYYGHSNHTLKGFDYCKPVVQVDDTFLTKKYHGILLVSIAQDGNKNIFPLAFEIVKGEMKEALIWFFQLLCQYVTPQPKLCLIEDRGSTILSTL